MFLRNHAPDTAAMDLFVAPTIGFDLLYAFVIHPVQRTGTISSHLVLRGLHHHDGWA